jgi:hypothetical protein
MPILNNSTNQNTVSKMLPVLLLQQAQKQQERIVALETELIALKNT